MAARSPRPRDVQPALAAAIVRAATQLFHRYGYKKTSVELIAKEARVAKPTIYAHFRDKEAVFAAVCQAVVDDIQAKTEAAESEPDVVRRISRMLSAKFTTVYALVDSSPHAGELLASQEEAAQAIVEAADQKYVATLRRALRAAVAARELPASTDPRALTTLLMQAGHGASYDAESEAQHARSIEALVRALLGR